LAGTHTVILSTHILPEVSMTCNRVVIINDGRLIAIDTPQGLANQQKGAERIALLIEGQGGGAPKACKHPRSHERSSRSRERRAAGGFYRGMQTEHRSEA